MRHIHKLAMNWRYFIVGILSGALIIGSTSTIVLSTKNKAKPTPTPPKKPSPSPTPIVIDAVKKIISPTFIQIPTSTPTLAPPSPSVTSTIQSPSTNYPSHVLDLTNWKITLPTGGSEKPTEIQQPELATFTVDPWFVTESDGKAVRFRAPVNGVTTSGSGYPRSELREMTNSGKDKASWSSTAGTHTMVLDQAITAVPQTKKHVVAGQIHDANDDVIVIRLELPNLYVNVDGKNEYALDSDYTLGKRFTVKFAVNGGQTKVYYNDSADPVYTLDKSYSGAYFKTGAYTQSNCSRESSEALCNDHNYGEVLLFNVRVTHE